MTTAKPPARYSAMESARSGDFATPELHHPSGHDLTGPDCPSNDPRIFCDRVNHVLTIELRPPPLPSSCRRLEGDVHDGVSSAI
jgi:hypothetical protein